MLAVVAVAAVALVAMTAFAPTAEAQSCSYSFATNLKLGSTGTDVMNLQKLLNMNAATQVSTSGAGAPGQESSYFGAKTRAAVIKWQNLYASEVLAPVGLTSGTGFFGASSRAKANALCTGGSTGSTGGSTVPTTGGALNVTAGAQPANALAVGSANRVPFTRIVVTAGANPVTVNSVTVERVGPAVDAIFSGVVLLDEQGNQWGIAKTLNSNHQASVGDPIVIPAGTSRTLTIAGNLATTATLASYAGQVVGLNVVSVNTNGTVSGTLPVSGAFHTVNATLSIGTATVAVSSLDPNAAQSKEIGTTNYKFSGFRITAGSAEQIRLRSVRWNQVGSASSGDIANAMTYVDGVAYPTTVDSSGKYYTTSFGSGIVIDKGLGKDVYIQADIVGSGAAARTVQFDIYKATDIYLTGETYGYGITATAPTTASAGAGSQFTTGTPFFDGSTVTVTAGSVTTVSKANSVAAQNIAVNVPSQILGAYEIDLKGEPISVQQHVFTVATSSGSGTGVLTNVSLYGPNGNIVAGPVDANSAGTSITFTDTVTYPIGKGIYTLRGKVASTIGDGTVYTLSTTPSSQWSNVTGQTTGNTISLSSLSSSVSMNAMTVKGASLAITVSSAPSAQTITAGSQGVTFANIQLDASNSGEDVRFSSIQLAESGSGTATNLSACQLFDGTTALNSGSNIPTVAAGANTFTFDSPLTVPKGTVKTLALKCNVSSGATGTYAWGTSASTNPTVTGVTSSNDVSEVVTISAGQTMTVGTGSFTVTKDASSPSYTIVAGGTTATIGVLRFTSTNEAINLERVRLQLTNTASSSPNSLVQVTLWDGATQVGTATFTGANTIATSTLSSTVQIPKDGSKLITIKADLAAIGSGAATSTSGALVAIDYDGGYAAGTKGTGASSGTAIESSTSSDTAMDGVRVMKSYPTLAKDSVGIANNKLNNGTGALLRFRVTANSAGDVGLYKFTFTLSTTTASVTSVNVFGYTDSAYSQPVSGVTSGGQLRSSDVSPAASGLVELVITNSGGTATPLQVPAGTTRYFEVRGTVTGSATGASVSTQLEGDAAYPSLAPGLEGLMADAVAVDADATHDDFIWSPNSTTTSATTNNDWTNGFGVPGLPATNLSPEVLSF